MAKRGAPGNVEGWFGILEVCRKLGKNGGIFTAADLDRVCRFKGTEDTRSSQIASGWLGKFARWGYVERGEPDKSRIGAAGGRPQTTYTLTDDGEKCEERPGRLTRLIRAVRAHQGACAGQQLDRIYASLQELARVCDEVERNDPGDR